MSKLGAVCLSAVLFASTAPAAWPAEPVVPHKISHDAAWGCRDKHEVFDLLFLGLSTAFDDRLASALANGRCIYFTPGETVTIIEDTASHGLVKVQRGGSEPVTYWTPARNLD